jgi:tetratricopeptide (TPR) repeat protein
MASTTPRSNRRTYLLLAGLIVIGLVYLLLRPSLDRMRAETARIDRETAAKQTAIQTATSASDELKAAQAAAEARPTDGAAQLNYAARLSAAGQFDEAASRAETAAQRMPDSPDPLLMLADIGLKAKWYDRAMQADEAAIRRFPGDTRPIIGLGWIYSTFGWAVEARDLLSKAAARTPDNAQLQVALALADLQSGDAVKAAAILSELRKRQPQEARLWSPLADVYLKAGKTAQALEVTRAALAQMPGDVQLLNGLGRELYATGDLANAAAAFRQIIAAVPANIEAHYQLALCLKRDNHPADAAHELEMVAKTDPDYQQTALLLGQIYVQQGRTAEGRQLMQRYQQQQQKSDANAKANVRLLSTPYNADAHYKMALVYRDQPDIPRMIGELYRTLQLQPAHAGAKQLYAEAMQQRQTVAHR